MFKVDNKDTRTTPPTVKYTLIAKLILKATSDFLPINDIKIFHFLQGSKSYNSYYL